MGDLRGVRLVVVGVVEIANLQDPRNKSSYIVSSKAKMLRPPDARPLLPGLGSIPVSVTR